MAASIGTLAYKLIADPTGFEAGIGRALKAVDKFASQVGKGLASVPNAIGKLISAPFDIVGHILGPLQQALSGIPVVGESKDPPQGPEVKIFLEFTAADGQPKRVPIEKTLIDPKTAPHGLRDLHGPGYVRAYAYDQDEIDEVITELAQRRAFRTRVGRVLDRGQLGERQHSQAQQDHRRRCRPADLQAGVAVDLRRHRALALAELDQRIAEPDLHREEDDQRDHQRDLVQRVDLFGVGRRALGRRKEREQCGEVSQGGADSIQAWTVRA